MKLEPRFLIIKQISTQMIFKLLFAIEMKSPKNLGENEEYLGDFLVTILHSWVCFSHALYREGIMILVLLMLEPPKYFVIWWIPALLLFHHRSPRRHSLCWLREPTHHRPTFFSMSLKHYTTQVSSKLESRENSGTQSTRGSRSFK